MLLAVGVAVVLVTLFVLAKASFFKFIISSFTSSLQASVSSGLLSEPSTLPSSVVTFLISVTR